LITVALRAATRASKEMFFPSFQRSTVIVSPGNTGAENRARWEAMLSEIDARDRAAERRLAEAERALNRLNLN